MKLASRFAPVRRIGLPVLLLSTLSISCAAAEQDAGGRSMGRLAPPADITCDHNDLTSWTGRVTGYRRTADQTWLEISTDEDTIEQTSIDHAGGPDASAQYLLWSEPFPENGWAEIEIAPGQLKDGMRATAWICLDGVTAPVIDWQPNRD